MNYITRIPEIVREDGVTTLLAKVPPHLYQLIWPHMPSAGWVEYYNVKVSEKKITDHFLPNYIKKYVPTDRPKYESALLTAVANQTNSGEKVVIVGGGYGVSTVIAAQNVGDSGHVVTFEGSLNQYKTTKKTVEINEISDRVSLHHAIVSLYSNFSTTEWGDPENATLVAPADLPECDVLELDCEGAEKEIIPELDINPTNIIVETHGFLGSGKDKITSMLESRSYTIQEITAENKDMGVYIISAELKEKS